MKKGWQTKKLGDLCTVFADGDWVESKDQSPDGIRLVQTGNIGEGVFKARGEKSRYISEGTFKKLRCTEIFEGDCLISRLPDPVGRSCILPESNERMITAVDCTIVRFDQKQMLPAFFNLYSQSDEYLSAVAKECTGTTRSRISRSNLALTPVPVPPLPEQQRIVGILDESFEAITTAKANTEKNLQNARDIFERYLQNVFTQRGRGWVEATIGTVCTLKSGTTVPVAMERSEGDMPYVKVAEMTMPANREGVTTSIRFLNRSDVKLSWVIPTGAVIFPKRGGAILTNKKRLALVDMCADLNIMSVIPSDKLTPDFLYLYFLTVDMRKLGTGSSIPQINNYDIAPLPISFPASKEEQIEVTKALRKIEKNCQVLAATYEHKVAALDALKKSLLHDAFRGSL
jgi:type I restriction enzyme S subunit